MSDAITILHAILRTVHIVLGSAGLALFWVVIALPKGTRAHVRCGRVFVYVGWVVGLSAILSSFWALLHLDSFAALPSDEIQRASLREIYRFVFAVLLFLSFATLSGLKFGTESSRNRERHDQLRRSTLPWWLGMTEATALGLAAFGIWMLSSSSATKSLTGGLPWAAYFVPALLGCFGAFAVANQLRYVYGRAPGRQEWLYQHVWNMCGTGVAFHTAFLVFGANRLFAYQLPGAWAMVPWIAPPAIGMTLTAFYVRRLRRRGVVPGAKVSQGGS